nr:sigma-54-dependent Fis family transcriptional regulator [Desulfobacterales bacterium]
MRLLIVDDERLLRNSLKRSFERDGATVYLAQDAREALQKFRKISPDLTLLDVRLPDRDGFQVLREIHSINPDAIVILMTAYSGIRGAVEAIKGGAFDYIAKPFDTEELKFAVSKALEVCRLKKEIKKLREDRVQKYHFGRIITNDENMKKVCALARKVAESPTSTVLIQGESGTGKELLCRAIHYNSNRKDKPLVVVNCAALPENLLESELFGHEKGAFTGATRRKIGILETANEGTVFLDEIGDISPSIQVKLLRFLQENEFYRVGGTRPIKVDVRIIAATNRNLEKETEEGRFREDLYYRLNVFPIHLPPLRERRGDISLLAKYFLAEFNMEFKKHVKGFSPEAIRAMEEYHWKGNIRELRNVIERAMILTEGDWILASELPPEVRWAAEKTSDEEVVFVNEVVSLKRMEATYIKKVLDLVDGNKSAAARLLGITRQRLKRKLSQI